MADKKPEELEHDAKLLDRARKRAAQRAHDAELAALANLALIRSGFQSGPAIREERSENARPTPEELEERLRHIIDEADKR